MILLVGALVAVPVLFGWSLCRAAALGDRQMDDAWDVVHCFYCDSDDVDDWGEPGWWACRECHMLFHERDDQ